RNRITVGFISPSLPFRTERALVQPDRGLRSRLRLNRENIEPARCFIHAPRAKELPRHAREIAALLPIYGFLSSRLIRIGCRSCFYFHQSEDRAVVTDHIDFALNPRRRVVSRNQNVAVAAQIPVSVRLASNSGSARLRFSGVLRRHLRQALASGEIHGGEHQTREHSNLLNHLEFPLHRLSANHERQIILPESSDPASAIDQKLKTECA